MQLYIRLNTYVFRILDYGGTEGTLERVREEHQYGRKSQDRLPAPEVLQASSVGRRLKTAPSKPAKAR
jgi:hypothetical protein